MCVLSLAMAMMPLAQAFVIPGSGFSALHGRDVASSASSKVSVRDSNATYSKSVSKSTYRYSFFWAQSCLNAISC